MHRLRSVLLMGLLCCVVCPLVVAQEWTRFRGPNGAGTSAATTIPASWDADDYNWVAELPGVGHSSPVIWQDRIFLTSATEEGQQRHLHCLAVADGSILWTRTAAASTHRKHSRNSYASPTPAVDAERVYVLWADPSAYVLVAFDHKGERLWQRDFGPFAGGHGVGTSPMVYGDMVVLGKDEDVDSSLIALDAATGKDRWRVDRTSSKVAYSTPCVYQNARGEDELIFNSGTHGISSIDPASGQLNWEIQVFDKRSVSSPIVAAGLIFGSCGSGAGGNYVVAVRPGDAASGVEPEEAFRVDKSAPYVPTSVAHEGLVFLWSDGGIVTPVEVPAGVPLRSKRVGGKFSGSPVCVAGRLYCVSDDGDVVVLSADSELTELARVSLEEECRSTPAVAGGRMYLRTITRLYSLGAGGG